MRWIAGPVILVCIILFVGFFAFGKYLVLCGIFIILFIIILLHWLKIKHRIDYKILSLTYKVLTTSQPSYLYNLISVQPHRSTRFSDIITLSRPPSSSSLKVNNRSFRHASPACGISFPIASPAYRSRRLITIIWSHTCQFVFSCITTVTIHYSFPLLLQTQNSSFPQIFFFIVLLPFHPPDWLHGL